MRNSLNRIIAAAAALLLVLVALVFISIHPALTYSVPALLWAVAGIVRAINSTSQDDRPPLDDSATPQNLPADGDDEDRCDDLDEPSDDLPAPEGS